MAQTTTDHETIRKWAEARDGRPARVKGTGDAKDAGLLRLDFGNQRRASRPSPGKSSSISSRKASSLFLYEDEPDNRFSKLVRR